MFPLTWRATVPCFARNLLGLIMWVWRTAHTGAMDTTLADPPTRTSGPATHQPRAHDYPCFEPPDAVRGLSRLFPAELGRADARRLPPSTIRPRSRPGGGWAAFMRLRAARLLVNIEGWTTPRTVQRLAEAMAQRGIDLLRDWTSRPSSHCRFADPPFAWTLPGHLSLHRLHGRPAPMGVPVVHVFVDTFVTASHLSIGLTETVATTMDQYVEHCCGW